MHNSRVFTKYDCERINGLTESYSVKDPFEKEIVDILLSNISRSKPVDQKKIKPDIVTINSRFTLRNLGNGMKEEYYLVLPKDADPQRNRLSIFSDLGSQILGNSIGAVVKRTNGKTQYFSIDDIIYQPEASGDYHL